VIALALTALSGGVDPSFANQGEAEQKYRSINYGIAAPLASGTARKAYDRLPLVSCRST
jgi:hypothetical protein